jgi:predicted AlkP superfamily pyrophosphatase or phosphodiesterase
LSRGSGSAAACLMAAGVWLLNSPVKAAPPKPGPAAVIPNRKLIVISIEGLDSRFFRDADRLHIKIPNLRRMAASGISADVVGMAPSLTWPAHAMIATGTPPEVNGITDNEKPGQPDDRWWFEKDLKTTPIWHAASLKGLKTATIYWPGTVGAHVDFNCPEYWEGKAENATQFDQITAKCTPGLIDRIARWDNSFLAPLWDDAVGIDVLRFLLTKEKLDLILLHLPELAAEQRETGALSIYARRVLENDDELLGTALQRMEPGTAVAIVSDHGFDTVSYVVRPKVMVKAAALEATVSVKYGLIGTSSVKAAAILRKAIGVSRSGIAREVPMLEVHRLAPDVRGWVAAFDTTLNFVATEETRGPAVGAGNHRGVQGLWPTHDSSRAVFILTGPGVKHVRLPEISILEEAPTFAEILGVRLVRAHGMSVLGRK